MENLVRMQSPHSFQILYPKLMCRNRKTARVFHKGKKNKKCAGAMDFRGRRGNFCLQYEGIKK